MVFEQVGIPTSSIYVKRSNLRSFRNEKKKAERAIFDNFLSKNPQALLSYVKRLNGDLKETDGQTNAYMIEAHFLGFRAGIEKPYSNEEGATGLEVSRKIFYQERQP